VPPRAGDTMDNIVIIGSSGHAKVVIDIVRREGRYHLVGLLDRFRAVGEETLGYRVLGREEDLPGLVATHALRGMLVAVGDNFARATVVARVRALCPDLPWVTAIHPAACLGLDVVVGEGTVVMAGVTINACASVGRGCVLNTRSSLDHDCVLSDYASLAPGVVTGGGCRIGPHAALGIGAVLVHGVEVGEHTVIGAGSVVTKSIDPFVVAYGTPARVVRARKAGDAYL